MTPLHDRRRSPRRRPHGGEPLARLRLRTGREVLVVNVAACGVLVEAETRLLPGTNIDVHIVTPAGRATVRSRIVRAFVWRVSGDRIVYRGGLAFERDIDAAAGYAFPSPRSTVPRPEGRPYPGECT